MNDIIGRFWKALGQFQERYELGHISDMDIRWQVNHESWNEIMSGLGAAQVRPYMGETRVLGYIIERVHDVPKGAIRVALVNDSKTPPLTQPHSLTDKPSE